MKLSLSPGNDSSGPSANLCTAAHYKRLSTTKPKSKMESSPLARLPPELRNTIYEMVVLEEDPIDIEADQTTLAFPIPGLLRTCSQLCAEASSIFYGRNIFVVSNPEFSYVNETECILHEWLRMLGGTNRALLREVRLHSDYHPVHPNRVSSRIAQIRQRLAEKKLEIEKARIWVMTYTGEYDDVCVGECDEVWICA